MKNHEIQAMMKKANILKYMYIPPYLDEFNKKKKKKKKKKQKKKKKKKKKKKNIKKENCPFFIFFSKFLKKNLQN